MANRYIDLGVGSLDLYNVQSTYCEPRKDHWWQRARPALIAFHYGDNGELQFLFDNGTKRDAAHRRLVEALNHYSAASGCGTGQE